MKKSTLIYISIMFKQHYGGQEGCVVYSRDRQGEDPRLTGELVLGESNQLWVTQIRDAAFSAIIQHTLLIIHTTC